MFYTFYTVAYFDPFMYAFKSVAYADHANSIMELTTQKYWWTNIVQWNWIFVRRLVYNVGRISFGKSCVCVCECLHHHLHLISLLLTYLYKLMLFCFVHWLSLTYSCVERDSVCSALVENSKGDTQHIYFCFYFF